VLPAITDATEALDHLVASVAERGAAYVNACALRLRSTARARYLPFIEQEFPHLAKRYRATYAFDHKVSASYATKLRERMAEICGRHGIPYGRWGAAEEREDQSEAIADRFANADQLDLEWNAEPLNAD
jgi:DNA repair photolyase